MTDHKEKVLFCQVDANLDSNPKIVAAGGLGTAVFQFVLRRVKVLGTDGWVRARDIDPEYLSSQLRFPASDMLSGVSAAVRAGLITDITDSGRVHVVGWTVEWDGMRRTRKEPKIETDEEREARLAKDRARKAAARAASKLSESNETDSAVSANVQVCPDVSADVQGVQRADTVSSVSKQQEKRREEKREGERETRARERHPDAGAIAHAVWLHANAKGNELRAANVNVKPWPLMASGQHSGWIALLDRVGELLVGSGADEARRRAINRVDVAAAGALASGEGHWFTPNRMFSKNSFETFVDDDPSAIERKPTAATKRGPTDPIRKTNVL